MPKHNPSTGSGPSGRTKVALIRTSNRGQGTRRALELLGVGAVAGKSVFIKPNFNSADPAPGSTHDDILAELVDQMRQRGAASIRVGDRSGMGETRDVMQQKGIFAMAKDLRFEPVVFDDLPAEQWTLIQREGHHWKRGFALPKPVLDADVVVQACCVKTHQYGGNFTMSLKNSVGLAAKYVPGSSYNYMGELHGSPDQRKMIAELNVAYRPALIVMDGVQAFTHGGPASGTTVESNVVLAGTDRIALDAVGVAVLRHFGAKQSVQDGPIFGLEQVARAVELGVGVRSPDAIEIVSDDQDGRTFANELEQILAKG
ncbi:MAG: DUF362 domain-containing protein [Myxococcota bacterium]